MVDKYFLPALRDYAYSVAVELNKDMLYSTTAIPHHTDRKPDTEHGMVRYLFS